MEICRCVFMNKCIVLKMNLNLELWLDLPFLSLLTEIMHTHTPTHSNNPCSFLTAKQLTKPKVNGSTQFFSLKKQPQFIVQNKFQCMHFPSFIPIILYSTSITPFILAFKLNGTRFLSASINLPCTHVSIIEATIIDRTASPSSVYCNHKASWYCYHRIC